MRKESPTRREELFHTSLARKKKKGDRAHLMKDVNSKRNKRGSGKNSSQGSRALEGKSRQREGGGKKSTGVIPLGARREKKGTTGDAKRPT